MHKAIFRLHWLHLGFAVIAALTLWYTVNAKEQVERSMEVRLNYKGLPSGLVITEGQLNKIEVRLRGPLELLRSMNNKDLSYTIDLSTLVQGVNTIPLYAADTLSDFRIYEVIDVTPSRLTLTVDNILEARLPIEATLQETALTPSMKLTTTVIEPNHATVRGPSKIVSSLKKLNVTIPANPANENIRTDLTLPLEAPPGVDIVPTTVDVSSIITIQRRLLSLKRDVLLDVQDNFDYSVSPSQVVLRVSVPAVAVAKQDYLDQIQAAVSNAAPPTNAFQNTQNITSEENELSWVRPVQVTLPIGARLQQMIPQTVSLTRAK